MKKGGVRAGQPLYHIYNSLNLEEIFALGKLLHDARHGDALARCEACRRATIVYDARPELLNLIAQARLIPLIEVLLVAVLVLVAQLKVVGLPPWRGYIDIALCAREDEVTLGLYAQPNWNAATAPR